MYRLMILVLTILFWTAPTALAQIGGSNSTWTGNTNGNWNVANNWSPSSGPNSNIGTRLTFGATSNGGMSNDISGTFTLNGMTFNAGAATYTLAGNPLDFRANVVLNQPFITMNSGSGVTLSNGLLTNNLTVGGSGTGPLTFNGPISGAGSLTCSGAGNVYLGNGSNSYAGGTVVNSGILVLTSGSAIPAGSDVTVNSGAQFNIGSTRNYTNDIGTLNLNGGTFRVPSGFNGDYYLNQLVMSNGTVDTTGSTNFGLSFEGAGAGITINFGTSTITGSASSLIKTNSAGAQTITVNGFLLNVGIPIYSSGGGGFIKAGSGSMRLSSTNSYADL